MDIATLEITDIRHPTPFPSAAELASWEAKFPPLEQEQRTHVDTNAAAHYLNRRPQTLRSWACLENGPLRPVRVNGRLSWSTAAIRLLLSGVEQ